MKALLLGVVVAPAAIILILSIRPGGLRQQLRMAGRRLRLALVLAGVYLALALGLRIVFSQSAVETWGTLGVALVLALVFIVLAADPPVGGRPRM